LPRADDHNEDARFRLLRLVAQNPEITQRQLSWEVGISLGKLHFLLTALIEKGFVKLGNFSASPDKRRYAYLITRKGLMEKKALTERFLERKEREYEALRSEIENLRADILEENGDPAVGKSNRDAG
jgi:EPS-associated MarR family transcriptional regulator